MTMSEMPQYLKGGLLPSIKTNFINYDDSPVVGDVRITANGGLHSFSGAGWQPIGEVSDEATFPVFSRKFCDLGNECYWPKDRWSISETLVYEPQYVNTDPPSVGLQIHYDMTVAAQYRSAFTKDYLVCHEHWKWAMNYLQQEALECARTQEYLAEIGTL